MNTQLVLFLLEVAGSNPRNISTCGGQTVYTAPGLPSL